MNDDEEGSKAEEEDYFGIGQTTPFAIELQIGRGEVKLQCRETSYSSGPSVEITLAEFELIFAAKFLTGISDYLYICAQTLNITHRGDNCHEFTPWVYAKTSSHRFNPRGSAMDEESDPMLSLSVKIENEEISRSLAHFTVAISLSNTTGRG
jgi:hypothetical protein